MGTVFCSQCGYIIARNTDDMEQAVRDSGYSACPDCGSTEGIGWSPSEMSQEEIRGALNTPHRATIRPGENAADAIHRAVRDEIRRERRGNRAPWVAFIALLAVAAVAAAWFMGALPAP
jgi:hypothetical protein